MAFLGKLFVNFIKGKPQKGDVLKIRLDDIILTYELKKTDKYNEIKDNFDNWFEIKTKN